MQETAAIEALVHGLFELNGGRRLNLFPTAARDCNYGQIALIRPFETRGASLNVRGTSYLLKADAWGGAPTFCAASTPERKIHEPWPRLSVSQLRRRLIVAHFHR